MYVHTYIHVQMSVFLNLNVCFMVDIDSYMSAKVKIKSTSIYFFVDLKI